MRVPVALLHAHCFLMPSFRNIGPLYSFEFFQKQVLLLNHISSNSKPISIDGGEFLQIYHSLQLRNSDYCFNGNDDTDFYNRSLYSIGLPMRRKLRLIFF